jgi:hypothetical protein
VDQTEESIFIFAGDDVWSPSSARRGLKESAEAAAGKVSEVAVSTLQENMRKFLHSLSLILSTPPEDVGGLALDTVEVSAQIDGKGNIGMIGVGTAEMAVHGGLKLILKKKA